MSKFGELLKKGKEENVLVETSKRLLDPKVNPFAVLGKAVDKAKDGTLPSASKAKSTAAAGVESSSLSSQTPVAPFAMLAKKKPSADTSPIPPKSADATSPDTSSSDIMSGVSGDFSEEKSAKQFQAEDQPEGYEQKQIDELKSSLDILVNSMDNKELVGDALKKIMLDLKRYPFLVNIMHPEDCNLMVRAVRESYGVTLAKKQDRSDKRKATSKEVEDTLELLGDMEINL